MNKNETISSVASNQHKIIFDICQLYNNGNTSFDLDLIYSEGKFYGEHTYIKPDGTKETLYIEQPKHKCDVAPISEDILKIEPWGNLPFENDTMQSIMFDPPFIISPRTAPSVFTGDKTNNRIFRRFSGYYPVNELLDSYFHWMKECYRVLKDDGILIFKNQPTVTGGKQLNTHHWVWLCSEILGFDVVDEFILMAKQRIIGKIQNQQHARKYHSYFYVIRKSTKKKTNYLNFMTDDEIALIMKKFIENNKGANNGVKNKYKEDIKPQTHIIY